MSAKERIPLRVRSETAVTDGPVMVDPKGPIRVVVSPKYTFALRGMLADNAGRPISKATIHLRTHWRTGSGGIGFELTTTEPDSDGKFQFLGLWPGDQYQVVVEPEGYEKIETPLVTGEAGKSHDFAKLTLLAARGVVEGLVVDSANKPMTDVRVFNTGDAPQTVSTKSDSAGRFRLEGLRPGVVYVFAEKPEHRFTGVRTTSGATGVVVRLLRQDEQIPQPAARPEPSSLEEQRKLARELLKKLWAECDRSKLGGAISAMNQLDPELARKWSAESGKSHERYVRAEIIEKTAYEDLDEALALLAQDGLGALASIKKMAERYAASDPAKAMRCAEEMTVRARALDQPHRTAYLAEAGGLVMRLGNREAGRQLVDEAFEMAAKIPASQAQTARGSVARAMACYDLERALALLETKPDDAADSSARYQWTRDVEALAVAICPEKLDQALELVNRLDRHYADRAKLRMAWRLAPTRPADALRVVETIPSCRRRARQAYGVSFASSIIS
jgi:hypothetical protein